MGIELGREVKDLMTRSVENIVEIRTCNIMGDMSSRVVGESSSGVGDDGGDSDKRGARSMETGTENEDDEAGIGDGDVLEVD